MRVAILPTPVQARLPRALTAKLGGAGSVLTGLGIVVAATASMLAVGVAAGVSVGDFWPLATAVGVIACVELLIQTSRSAPHSH